MQAIRQLDEDDANIFRHRQGHFLEVLGLPELHRIKFDMGELADTIDQFGDLFAELGANVLFVDACVLNHIVQQGGHQALGVHVHASENAGYRQRMGNVWFSATAGLTVMGLLGVVISSPHQLRLLQRQVVSNQLLKGSQ